MHPLDGPRVKIGRAKAQIEALHFSSQTLFERNPFSVIKAERDRRTGHHILRAKGGPPSLPADWGPITGEIAYDLRSALDGLVWQLAKLGTIAPYYKTSFPICLTGRGTVVTVGDRRYRPFRDYGGGWGLLRDVPRRRIWRRIESFQPYKRGNGNRHSPLFLLNEMNNTDKHRLLIVLAVVAHGMGAQGLMGGVELKLGVPLYDNAKVGYVVDLPPDGVRVVDFTDGSPFLENGRIKTRVEHEVQIDAHITPGINFGSGCDAIERLPVIPTLRRIADQVNTIIESFSEELSK